MAAALGITVVAEGIETVAQLNVLQDLGCPLGQGYLFARPAPARRAAGLARSQARRPAAGFVAPSVVVHAGRSAQHRRAEVLRDRVHEHDVRPVARRLIGRAATDADAAKARPLVGRQPSDVPLQRLEQHIAQLQHV